jgi:hypothetical protein
MNCEQGDLRVAICERWSGPVVMVVMEERKSLLVSAVSFRKIGACPKLQY